MAGKLKCRLRAAKIRRCPHCRRLLKKWEEPIADGFPPFCLRCRNQYYGSGSVHKARMLRAAGLRPLVLQGQEFPEHHPNLTDAENLQRVSDWMKEFFRE